MGNARAIAGSIATAFIRSPHEAEDGSAYSRIRRIGIVSWSAVGVILLAIVIGGGITALSGILTPLVIAVIVGAVLEPIVGWLTKHRVPRGLAAGLVLLAATAVVSPGVERQVTLAVLADAFIEPFGHLPTSLHDLLHVRDVGAGWHDSIAMMWSPATLVHGANLSHGKRQTMLSSLSEDIVWNGEEIVGMSERDADALEAVHAQRG